MLLLDDEMNKGLGLLAAFVLWGCSTAPVRLPVDASSDEDGAVTGTDALAESSERSTTDGRSCGCRVEADGVLTMTLECSCQQVTGSCGFDRDDAQGADLCGGRDRIDYVDCELSVVELNNIGNTAYAFDPSGELVGTRSTSDTSDYVCPDDASLTSLRVRAGRFPAASCQSRSCGGCNTSPFPCAVSAGGG